MSTLLDTLYASLPPATELPQGTYDGIAYPLPAWPLWQGKVFTGPVVRNRIAGLSAIEGVVTLSAAGEVEIYYYALRLTDYLRPVAPGVWLGWTQPRRIRIWFLLTRVP